jgi:hypothetical protein
MNLPQICSRWSRICRSMVEREYLPYRLVTFQGREFLLIFIFPSALCFLCQHVFFIDFCCWGAEVGMEKTQYIWLLSSFPRGTRCSTCSWCDAMQCKIQTPLSPINLILALDYLAGFMLNVNYSSRVGPSIPWIAINTEILNQETAFLLLEFRRVETEDKNNTLSITRHEINDTSERLPPTSHFQPSRG